MAIQDIADRLVALCRAGQNLNAYKTLFSENASAHDLGNPNAPVRTGLSTLLASYEGFHNSIKDMHRVIITDPTIISEHYFACGMAIDFTGHDGTRHTMSELCVYEVRDSKIVKETFYYG